MREFRIKDRDDVQRRIGELLDALDMEKVAELLDIYFYNAANLAATTPASEPAVLADELARMKGVRSFLSWAQSMAREIREQREAAASAAAADGDSSPVNAEDMTASHLGMRERRSGHRSERFLER